MSVTRLLLPILVLFSAPLQAGDIAWKGDLRDTLREAKASELVVFVAVNMDGERANDRMAKDVYTDKLIEELAGRTLNLVASNDSHAADGKTCPRFGQVTCKEHRHVDIDVRGEVLSPDEEGYVVAPQHVFLGPDGGVLLSVPYEVSVPELEWCFITALKTVDPDLALELSKDARPPKRLVMGGVHTLGAGADETPLSREAALELVAELKKGTIRGAERRKSLRKLAMADEKEARDYILGVLRTAPGGGRGGGGRGGGGPRGGGMNEDRNDMRPQFLHWIGANSPVSYWEVCAEFLGDNDVLLRGEAVVAVQQLGSSDALKAIQKALRKEKDETVAKNLLRALGTCGADDKTARRTLLKQAGSDKKPLLQANAIVALGWLSTDDDVAEFLTETFSESEGQVQIGVVLAMAITRDETWVELLQAKLEEEPEAPLRVAIEASLAVLKGGPLGGIENNIGRVASDELKRERLFGTGRRRNEGEGGRGGGDSRRETD
jgi:hypothetical protein